MTVLLTNSVHSAFTLSYHASGVIKRVMFSYATVESVSDGQINILLTFVVAKTPKCQQNVKLSIISHVQTA